MPIEVLFYGAGPLPQETAFNAPSDGLATFVLSGTATTQGGAACMTGLILLLDGEKIGQPAICWANSNNNHTAMMPTYIPVTLTQGSHVLEIINLDGNTSTDVNDVIQVVLIY